MEHNMAQGFLNGRRIEFPDVATGEEIAAAAGLPKGRRIYRQDAKGNWSMPAGQPQTINNGARFVDAPPRVKGFRV